ncbi:5102_t:CDS:2, partial [Cetraspora pellucida]
SRWFNKTSNNSEQEPFLIAQKFETEQNRKIVDERKLYRETWGKARAALMEEIFFNSNSDSNDSEIDSNNEVESDSISKKGMIDPKELVNPRKCKEKGWPKGTDRMRHANEPPKRAKRKLHCKICGSVGHNRATCSQRQK